MAEKYRIVKGTRIKGHYPEWTQEEIFYVQVLQQLEWITTPKKEWEIFEGGMIGPQYINFPTEFPSRDAAYNALVDFINWRKSAPDTPVEEFEL